MKQSYNQEEILNIIIGRFMDNEKQQIKFLHFAEDAKQRNDRKLYKLNIEVSNEYNEKLQEDATIYALIKNTSFGEAFSELYHIIHGGK